MTPGTLADRFVNYRDALAAFSVVNAMAFLIALTETEVRCSLPSSGGIFLLAFPIWAAVQSALLVACRRTETNLRRDTVGEAAEVARIQRILDVARHGVVWFAMLVAMVLAVVLARDPVCAGH